MENVVSDKGFYSTTSRITVPKQAVRPPSGRREPEDDYWQWWWNGLRVRGVSIWYNCCQKLTVKKITSDRRRNSHNHFTQKNLRSKRQNDKTPVQNKKWSFTDQNRSWMMVLSINQPFWASFAVLSFVVSSFRRFAIETEEPSEFQFFEFETRLAMIATIAMATRLTQPECAIKVQHVSQLFGWLIQSRGSRDDKKAFYVNSSTNRNACFVSVVRKNMGNFFSNFSCNEVQCSSSYCATMLKFWKFISQDTAVQHP